MSIVLKAWHGPHVYMANMGARTDFRPNMGAETWGRAYHFENYVHNSKKDISSTPIRIKLGSIVDKRLLYTTSCSVLPTDSIMGR